jgi:hypothetical protein
MARPGLTKHIKFKRLSRDLRSRIVARGVLELLWEPCYENGDDYLGTPDDVELTVQWDGEPGVLFKALLSSGFIEEIQERKCHYRVHDLFDHAPDYVQKRMKREAERVARGKTISDLRRDAANSRHHRNNANDMQTEDTCRHLDASGCKESAKVCTHAHAHAHAHLKDLGEESPTTPLVQEPEPKGFYTPEGGVQTPKKTRGKKQAKTEEQRQSEQRFEAEIEKAFQSVVDAWPEKGWSPSENKAVRRKLKLIPAKNRFRAICLGKAKPFQKCNPEDLCEVALDYLQRKKDENPDGWPVICEIGNFFRYDVKSEFYFASAWRLYFSEETSNEVPA